MQEWKKKLPTPHCNCYGADHRLGSSGCTFAVSEAQLRQDEARIADMIRMKTGSLESDEEIMQFIGSQAHAVEKRRQTRVRIIGWAILCALAVLAGVALAVWGR